jgi:hypothetical protein
MIGMLILTLAVPKVLIAILAFFMVGISTVGSIQTPAVPGEDRTAGGGLQTIPFAATVATAQLVSPVPGRLERVVVTTSAAFTWTFYDTVNTGSQAGATILGVVPASAAVGNVYAFQMPAAKGIVAVPSGAGAAVTVSYS